MEEKKMNKLEIDELKNVAGGLNVADAVSDPAIARMQSELVAKENAAAVAGMGLEKRGAIQGDMNGGAVRAYCPVCKKETSFRVSSGARSMCLICGNVRLDL